MYADGFPYLLCNEASVDKLNESLVEPISYANFRPNILVENTTGPYAEVRANYDQPQLDLAVAFCRTKLST